MTDDTTKKIGFKKVILPTIYEYLLILLPVAIYVGIESMHRGFFHFIRSPEWAIASIFLSFQGTALYFRHLNFSDRKPNFDFLGVLLLGVIAITITSTLNAYASLDDLHNTDGKVVLRLGLLLLSSVAFFILVFASKTEIE
jgi:hypothetical protein